MTAKVDARPADISVVINVYDNEATIGEALESVLRGTWPPGEVVVIDDGSTDRIRRRRTGVRGASARPATGQSRYQRRAKPGRGGGPRVAHRVGGCGRLLAP